MWIIYEPEQTRFFKRNLYWRAIDVHDHYKQRLVEGDKDCMNGDSLVQCRTLSTHYNVHIVWFAGLAWWVVHDMHNKDNVHAVGRPGPTWCSWTRQNKRLKIKRLCHLDRTVYRCKWQSLTRRESSSFDWSTAEHHKSNLGFPNVVTQNCKGKS